jgi:hypothetical protein
MLPMIANRWLLAAVSIVGITLSPVLVGFAPLAGDPELMYQPIKAELARSLAEGRLPFWSDRFGVGIPLIAESHVAAFYPPNWLLYRLWTIPTAYQLSFWLHALALAALTYRYAYTLGIGQAGSALTAISFSLCGFQAVHAVHEPFYHAVPYLPLCLLLTDRYATTGRWVWLAGLALAWGVQLTLGHFQIQMWTGGLVLFAGCWRILASGEASCQRRRILGLVAALMWGAAIAYVQLQLTWELTVVSGFDRRPKFLANYLMPPSHLAQFVLPEVYLGRPRGLGAAYWSQQGTTGGEACSYVGTMAFVLALVGAVAAPRQRSFAVWWLIIPLSLALATMPKWLPDAFLLILQVPGIGWFRAPARYTLLTCLGLALFAGRGFDRAISRYRFWQGVLLAFVLSGLAWVWSLHWAAIPQVQAAFGSDTILLRLAIAGFAWVLALAVIIGWRLNRVSSWILLGIASLQLGTLVYVGPVEWHWAVHLPEASPVLAKLKGVHSSGLIGGRLLNLPVYAGQAVAYPNLGITPPPPNYLLESTTIAPRRNDAVQRRWQRRLGVTHSIWESTDDVEGTDVLVEIPDRALDLIMMGVPSSRSSGPSPWKLVANPTPFPSAWVARYVHAAEDWGRLYTELSVVDAPEHAWFLRDDCPPPFTDGGAQQAQVESWDGQTAVVSRDASCILILRRTYYPGWTFQVDGGLERPVLRVDGGLQGIPLNGPGRSHIVVRYQPTGLARATAVSLTATASALIVLTVGALRYRYGSIPSR